MFPFKRQDIALFRFGQQDISGNGFSVRTFTGDSGQNIDGRIPIRVQRKIIFRLRHHSAHAVEYRQRSPFQGGALQFPDKAFF